MRKKVGKEGYQSHDVHVKCKRMCTQEREILARRISDRIRNPKINDDDDEDDQLSLISE